MSVVLTQVEADRIVGETKICTEEIKWEPVKSKTRRYRLEAKVLVPSQEKLGRIVGIIGKRNYSFSFLYDNQPIRKYTVHKKHKKPDHSSVEEPHKHIWDEINEDRECYIPDDIDRNDVNQAFKDFLAEIRVEMRGSYQDVIPL